AEPQRALDVMESGLAFARQHGAPREQIEFFLERLGEAALENGQLSQARAWLQECLELRYKSASFGIGAVLDRFAALAVGTSEWARSLRLAGAADVLYENLGARRTPVERLKVERWLAAPRAASVRRGRCRGMGSGASPGVGRCSCVCARRWCQFAAVSTDG